MKIDWSTNCKYRSIADSPCGRWTFCVSASGCGLGEWDAQWEDDEHADGIGDDAFPSREEAQAACESWLASQPPVLLAKWHVSDSGLAACSDEYLGWAMVVYSYAAKFMALACKHGEIFHTRSDQDADTLPAAQAAIEAEVLRVTQEREPEADTRPCPYCKGNGCETCYGKGKVIYAETTEDSRLLEESKKLRPSREELLKRVPPLPECDDDGNYPLEKAELKWESTETYSSPVAADVWTEEMVAERSKKAELLWDWWKQKTGVPIGPDGWVTDPNDVCAWKVVDGKTLQAWLLNRWSDDGWGWNVWSHTPTGGMTGSLAAAKAAAERAAQTKGDAE